MIQIVVSFYVKEPEVRGRLKNQLQQYKVSKKLFSFHSFSKTEKMRTLPWSLWDQSLWRHGGSKTAAETEETANKDAKML